MRTVFAALVIAGAVFSSAAHAEKRIFVIANNADDYGVDRCLSSGARCGVAVATAYCQSHDYLQAASFHKVDHDEVTHTVPVTDGSGSGGGYIAIECLR